MKTLLYTGFDAAYKPLADITVPRMREYAIRHGIDFTCAMSPLIDVPNGIYWTGVCGALEAFKVGYDRAIYLDVDQLITNMDFSLADYMANFQHGFHVWRDWGSDSKSEHDFSACSIITHTDCVNLLKEILSVEPEWRDEPFAEQGPMRHILNERCKDVSEPIYFHDRTLNKVPDAVSPGNIPEPWRPDDMSAHITMVDLTRRVEIATEILKLCT